MPTLRPHDMTLLVVALVVTLSGGLALGLLVAAAVFAGEELDNYF